MAGAALSSSRCHLLVLVAVFVSLSRSASAARRMQSVTRSYSSDPADDESAGGVPRPSLCSSPGDSHEGKLAVYTVEMSKHTYVSIWQEFSSTGSSSEEEVSDDSACVKKYGDTAVKPKSSDAEFGLKLDDIKDCFEECQPKDGWTAIDHNTDNGNCYCWKGEEGDEWEYQYMDDEVSYFLGDCADDPDGGSVGGGWSGWDSMGGSAKSSPYAAGHDGVEWVSVIGSDDALWVADRDTMSWKSMGGACKIGTAMAANPDRFDAMCVGADNSIYSRPMSKNGDAYGSTWGSTGGGTYFAPAATGMGDGRTRVVVRGTNDQLYWTETDNGIDFSNWNPIPMSSFPGSIHGAPSVIGYSSGAMAVYALDDDRQPVRLTTIDNDWKAVSTAKCDSDLTATPQCKDKSGCVTLACYGTDSQLWTFTMDNANDVGGSWEGTGLKAPGY